MKTYKVIVHTTLVTVYKVQANSKLQATEKYGMDAIRCGEEFTNEYIGRVKLWNELTKPQPQKY
jgi:hypothetical protein